MSELSIKVNIGGRSYPLKIKRTEEEKIRKAASKINENLKELKSNYAVIDTQDLLAMTVLQYATDSVSTNNTVEFDQLSDEIIALRDELIG